MSDGFFLLTILLATIGAILLLALAVRGYGMRFGGRALSAILGAAGLAQAGYSIFVSDGGHQLIALWPLVGLIYAVPWLLRQRGSVAARNRAGVPSSPGSEQAVGGGLVEAGQFGFEPAHPQQTDPRAVGGYLPAQRGLPRHRRAAPEAGGFGPPGWGRGEPGQPESVAPASGTPAWTGPGANQQPAAAPAWAGPQPVGPAPVGGHEPPSGLLPSARTGPSLPQQRFVSPGHRPQNLSLPARPPSPATPPSAGGMVPPVGPGHVRHQPGFGFGGPGDPSAARQIYVAPTFTPQSFPEPPSTAPAQPHVPPVQLPAYYQRPLR